MKVHLILIGLLLITCRLYSQKVDYSDEFIKQLENPEYPGDKLLKENFINKYESYDFSTLLIPRIEFIGYISSDFKRIKLYFTSISKDLTNQTIYRIKGLSVVDENKCDFEGSIRILQIRELIQMHFGIDDTFKNAGLKAQGVLVGHYEFNENKNQKYSGSFQGIMSLWWYVDKYGILHYDDLETFSDSYANNQYVGTWKSYSSKTEMTCNLGEWRIPFSKDLDIGAAGFSVNPKYKDKGWGNLQLK